MCIQTGDFITYYTKPSLLIDVCAEPARTICKAQFDRHGLGWNMGEVHPCELRDIVTTIVSPYSSIFVVDKSLIQFLKKSWGFEEVEMLHIAPTNTLHQHPSTACTRHDPASLGECAQRKCHEIMSFLKPVLIPYLDTKVFTFEKGSWVGRPPEEHKYGVYRLEEPLYHQLERLTLTAHGVKNCEFGMERSDEAKGGLGWATGYGGSST